MHIGLICPGLAGHLNPMAALGRELMQRGHRITFFGVPDGEARALREGVPFYPIGMSEYPVGTYQKQTAHLGHLSGMAALHYTLDVFEHLIGVTCRDLPGALKSQQIDALLVDQTDLAAATVAQAYEIPFVTICNALLLNNEPTIPPFFTTWSYGTDPWRQLRNRAGYAFVHRLMHPIIASIEQYRQSWHLPLTRDENAYHSRLAIISQLPREFDFPRRSLPPWFHYTGTFRTSTPNHVPFPYECLTDQPLVYASMGTLQNRVREVLHCIVDACRGVDVQLVLSLGGGSQVDEYTDLQKHALIVDYAPQLDLLSRAHLTITHAGLNTVLESLRQGVPMVAIPVTNDQPGVAARVAYAGAGIVVPRSKLNTTRLRAAIRRVLATDSYRQSAASLQTAIHRTGGVKRAVDVVEQAIGCLV
ncbi:MAG TPA: glycosyltransferase [Ktedonobacteraceae bacterium]|jgi:MGT family glycosyltransferase